MLPNGDRLIRIRFGIAPFCFVARRKPFRRSEYVYESLACLGAMKAVFGTRWSNTRSQAQQRELFASSADSLHHGAVETVFTDRASIRFVARNQKELDESLLSAGNYIVGVVGKIYLANRTRQVDLLAAILDEYVDGRTDLIRECFGEFVIVIVDKVSDELAIFSDVLSIRPVFCYENAGEFVFGSDAWVLLEQGLVPRRLNLNALSAWLLLDHVIGNDTIIDDVQRLPAGSYATVTDAGVRYREYAAFSPDDKRISKDSLLDRIGSAMQDTCESVAAREKRLNGFLSGGYDSRYLLCMFNQIGTQFQTYTVRYDSTEEDASEAVLRVLNREGIAIDVPRSVLDLHDGNPFYFGPWGFPAWKFVTEVPVRRFQLRDTLVDGLMGDELIRGYDYEVKVHAAIDRFGIGEGMLRIYTFTEPHAFKTSLGVRIRSRAISQIKQYFAQNDGDERQLAFQWLLTHRKSTFHTTNHLHNLECLETVHPFVNPPLIRLRLEHDNRLFDTDLYQRLFSRQFESVSNIPHSAKLRERYSGIHRFSWNIWRRLPAIFGDLAKGENAKAFRRGFLVPRIGAYGVGIARQLYLARQLWTIAMLCQRLEQQEISIPWDEI
jgi:hypothetical protein